MQRYSRPGAVVLLQQCKKQVAGVHPRSLTARPCKNGWLEDDPLLLGPGLFSAMLKFQGVLTTRAKMSKVDREIEGLILFGEQDVDIGRYVLNKKPLETLFRGV